MQALDSGLVIVTLSLSLVYAVAVTPLMAGYLLKRSAKPSANGWVERLAVQIGRLSVRRPIATLLGVALVVAVSGSFATRVGFNFFPSSDREQMVVSVALPEGTHLEATQLASRKLERALTARSDVKGVAAFVGRSAPRFYYNLPRDPQAPFLAQLVVTTSGPEQVGALQEFVRDFAARELPDASVVPRRLEQGPPVAAPIEIRLFGEDLSALHLASEDVQRLLRHDRRAQDVRADHGPGAPLLRFVTDDAAASRHGVSRAEVAAAIHGRTQGLDVGSYRAGIDPVPILLRAPPAEDHTLQELEAIELTSASIGRAVPVAGITRKSLEFAPAVIHRIDRRRVASVLAQPREGATYAAVLADLEPKLEQLELPAGVEYEIAGAAESSGDANQGLGSKAPVAGILLIAILLAQFNSIRKVVIVLVTAPLAVLGIWPGLFLADLPFGFVALLGAIALIGIVVNGAIVLIDLTETRRREGVPLSEALEAAVCVRTRPILLTTATTIAGLTPLLFSESTLWPPMASAMVSGLAIATALTLFAVPALYRLLFREPTST
ncbi:MAG: efflux RND transporter permease subunit [Polyangiaceae bacterium]